jgi:CubicO group peptidase (beta-lactamase class C family)
MVLEIKDKEAQLEKLSAEFFAKEKLPGLAMAAVLADGTTFVKTFGYADKTRNIPVTPDTVFRIGSISKTMTTIGILQLWEQGKFQLDDPVSDYLKAYRIAPAEPGWPPITFRHLLTHTAGLGLLRSRRDLLSPTGGLGVPFGSPVPALTEYYEGSLKASYPPGKFWSYANHGFATLGQLVDDISGQPFTDYMQSHVFAPLGMITTSYLRTPAVREKLATGYQPNGKPVEDFEIIVTGAGSVFSSLIEMINYVQALLNQGANSHGRILKPETAELLFRPHYQHHPLLPGIGLSFMLDRLVDHRIAWHNGGWPGFSSMLLLAPDDGVGILLFMNRALMNGAMEKKANELMKLLLPQPVKAVSLPAPVTPLSPQVLKSLTGYYKPEGNWQIKLTSLLGMGGGIEISLKDEKLSMCSLVGPFRKGVTLTPAAGEGLAFSFEHDGQPRFLAFTHDTENNPELCQDLIKCRRYPLRQSPRNRLIKLAGAGVFSVALVLARHLFRHKTSNSSGETKGSDY